MERILSVEEKIRRAEEIYAKRQEGNLRKTATVNVNKKETKKDIKLIKKMILQIIICLIIYMSIYVIQNNQFIFSEDFLNKAQEILSYDTNFQEIYENLKNKILTLKNNNNNNNEEDKAIGGANPDNTIIENNTNQSNEIQQESNTEIKNNINDSQEEKTAEKVLSQEEQDIINIKNTTNFIKPLQATISSRFGEREPTTSSVPKNHTGIDLAANMGTKIYSSTNGEVVLASEEGDYGKHLKIQIGEVSIIYAHCNNLYVKQGDIVTQGQEIAEVGSTGNSTGPHLHFEVRISERIIDPEKILEF